MHYSRHVPPDSALTAATEFCRRAKLKQRSLALLTADASPAAFLRTLLAKEHYADAIRMLAHRLSRREAVWWECLCLEHDSGERLTHEDQAALRAAVHWVTEPTEAHRRAAAEVATVRTPAGLLAKAVFWSGGSVSRPEYPAVPPLPHVCAQTVAGSLLLASAMYPKPTQRQSRRKEFLDLGFLVESGALSWCRAEASAPEQTKTAPAKAEVCA